ncbi:hypothetical protein B296_00018958 [Ensete ventricosum]|uniref:Single-stranded DNA binding protein Ssb-like OB fold domain-containing protein n=1 Tax=Ensete ventricosum TaxID=4639 RepID=A0A427AS60_ENSVE|nr:hypothetical protein B296_00018958 [Ensete ventricosum]
MATTQQQQHQGGAGAGKRKPVFVKVDQLKPGTSGHTLTAMVLTSETVLHKGRAAAAQLRPTRIAECLIGDETGTIVFTARNEQGSVPSLPSYLSFVLFVVKPHPFFVILSYR